jgi:hypothetical protein
VLELDKWLRRRMRLYYWKQWFRGHRPTRPGTQRTGTTTTDPTTPPDRPVDLKRGGPDGVIQPERLLANERQCSGATRLEQRLAAPSRGSLFAIPLDRYSLREGRYALSCGLIGTARCGPSCRVVWDPGLAVSVSLGDPISLSHKAPRPLPACRSVSR